MTTTTPSEDERSTHSLSSSYRDHSNELELIMPSSNSSSNNNSSAVVTKNGNGSSSETNFPVKLHYMLSDMEADGLDHIVSWQPHGRAFIVHKPKEFVSQVLLLWFRQSKFSSFQRQLNLYGFKRITAGPDKGAHYHELFLRGKRHLAHRIPRVKIKGQGARKPAQPSQEPNFYQMPYLPVASTRTGTTSTSTGTPQQQRPLSGGAVVEPRSLPSYSRMQTNNNNNVNYNKPEVSGLYANHWTMGNGAPSNAAYLRQFPHQQIPLLVHSSTSSHHNSLDQAVLMPHQPHPRNNYALSPTVLSALVKEQAHAVALLQQLRR